MRTGTKEKRFKIAFSFPGEMRERVERIVDKVAEKIPKECILYDRFHAAEFARPNLDVYLQEQYLNSELIVVFLCGEYHEKLWCGVEWRAIRSLLNKKQEERLMFIKCGEGEVDGIFDSLDGYLDLDEFGEQGIADAILNRYFGENVKVPLRMTAFHANAQYAKSFDEPLFLHKDVENTRVKLNNLFVLQKFQQIGEWHKEKPGQNLQEFIAEYLEENRRNFLFIEGDAGSGKTTLIAWMNYHYALGDDIGRQLFGDRPVITIRLRDLDKKELANSSLSSAILKYMKLSSLDQLEKMFPKAVMLLDGFDELCMIEGLKQTHEYLIYDLWKKKLKDFQFIVTTRPKFIGIGIDVPSKHIVLKHFEEEQRREWMERYTSPDYCSEEIEPKVAEYIANIRENTTSCICDTPMTLYMLVAKKDSGKYLDNGWALYRHIFLNELSETEYNAMFPNPDRDYAHGISIVKEPVYQISEEIAYRMYQQENQVFYLADEKVGEIVEELGKQHHILSRMNLKETTKKCYALCCYWKTDSVRGAVEFLHNNIRDFFLAEKIYREMNVLIQTHTGKMDEDALVQKIGTHLVELFSYGILEAKVTEFLYLRAKYQMESGMYDFAGYEYENRLASKVAEYLNQYRLTENPRFAGQTLMEQIRTMKTIMTCTVQLYRHLYEPYLKENEMISWGLSNAIPASNFWLQYFSDIFGTVLAKFDDQQEASLASRGDFRDVRLRGADLSCGNFEEADFSNANFSGANLNMVRLDDAVLVGAKFRGANIGRGFFRNANLSFSDLNAADMNRAILAGADLTNTNLNGTYLISADLSDVNFEYAEMNETNLRGADLRNANFRSAKMVQVQLQRAKLKDADFEQASLADIDLSCMNLKGTNFKDAALSGINLRNCNLQNVILPDGFCGKNSREQAEHLTEMKLPGVKV